MILKNYFAYPFLFIIASILLNSCVAAKYHDYAVTDFDQATKFIHQLKDDTIVVAVSTYKEEEDLYLRIINRGSKDSKKIKNKLSKLQERRNAEIEYIIDAFEQNFNFAKVLYIPDSLVHSFEEGEDRSFFINNNSVLDKTITYNNRSPIKILQIGGTDWTVVQGESILPNPFPNNYGYKNGLAVFLGLAPFKKVSNDMAKTFQLRFEKYFSNPSRRVYL